MLEEEIAEQRVQYIAKRQELLAKAVSKLQEQLFEAVLAHLDTIIKDPATLDHWFNVFTKTNHAKVIQQFAGDIMNIGKLNEVYFKEVAKNLDSKDYGSIKKDVDKYLLDRFGLSPQGKAVPDGFIDSFVKDPSLKRSMKEFAYKAQTSGAGLAEFKAGFKDLILGNEDKVGALQRHYSTFAYDTYQQADAAVQEQYAEKLELTACLYLGGEISGTRPFCHERNGKVFLREEIEDWKKINFKGKPANYNPFLDRGGYNCRHHYNYITDEMAMRRRSDLYVDEKGRLRAGTAPPRAPKVETVSKEAETGKFTDKAANGFKPAKNLKEAKTQHLNSLKRIGLPIESPTFGSYLSLDQYNQLGENLDKLTSEYNISSVWRKANPVKFRYKSNSGAYGYIASSGNGAFLNEVNFGDIIDDFDRLNPGTNGIRFKSRVDMNKTLLATQTHEFAHVISISSHHGSPFAAANVNAFWDELKVVKRKYHAELGKLQGQPDKIQEMHLGEYASTNINEFMAEGFTEYRLATKPSKYAKQVGELIDKHFKK